MAQNILLKLHFIYREKDLARLNQNPNFNLAEYLWHDSKPAVHKSNPLNLKELEQFRLEERTKPLKAKCAKLKQAS